MSEEQKKDSTDVVWVVVILMGAVYAIAHFYGDLIKTAYLTLKLYELKLIALVYASDDTLWLINKIETKNISSWTWKELTTVGSFVGRIINVLFMGVGAYFIYKVWKKNPYKKLTRKLDMFSLMMSERRVWPFLIPISHTNLLTESLDSGKYSMGMKPIEFVDKYKLLDKPRDLTSLNKMKAEKLFSSQIGKLWDGVDNLNPHCQALFGIFAAQAMGEKMTDEKGQVMKDAKGDDVKTIDFALQVVKDLATSTEGGKKPDFKIALPLINKYKNDPRVLKIMNKHAYNYTALASLYEAACKNGVLPPNYFLWLRVVNRPLYYFINCVGRRVSWVEVAGIFSHWKAEKVCRHPIEKPYVVKAREALEKALLEVKLVDE